MKLDLTILTGPFFSRRGNNANLMVKLIPFLQKQSDVRLLTIPGDVPKSPAAAALPGLDVLVFLPSGNDRSLPRQMTASVLARLLDRNGFSDYLMVDKLCASARKLLRERPEGAILTTMEPFPAADAAARLRGVKKILYLMDPPACISNGKSTPYRDRRLKKILAAQDAILTTPFIRQALKEHGYEQLDSKIIPVGFPLIEQHRAASQQQDDGRIHLLFCGWLYSDIRSPKYFLEIVSRLDERFVVTFMGRECEKLTERFEIHTKAELITLPQQPYETALQAMTDADILINIGNSVPVHMPSKTLEYINTGKPFVNFYKMDDCPTLYYSKRYPLCLNLSEQYSDLDTAERRFIQFCVQNKGKTAARDFIESEYADCTPSYIAKKILEKLGE